MPSNIHVRDLPQLVGRQLGHSNWHEITQSQVDQFADATKDRQWIHTDPQRAADSSFGGTIAHGFLTISMAPALLAEVFSIDGIDMMVNHRLGAVKFQGAVRVGAKLQVGVALTDVRPRPRDFVEATMKLTFDSELAGEVSRAAVAELVLLMHATDGEATAA